MESQPKRPFYHSLVRFPYEVITTIFIVFYALYLFREVYKEHKRDNPDFDIKNEMLSITQQTLLLGVEKTQFLANIPEYHKVGAGLLGWTMTFYWLFF